MKEYRLDAGLWNQVFAVPCAVVDRHLKLAGKEQLQVLLWALRHAGEGFTPGGLSQALGLSEEMAEEALEYWTAQGLLMENAGELSPAPQPEGLAPAASAQPAPVPLPPKKRMVKPDTLQLAARMEESEGVRFLMQQAESILGRTLSPAMTTLLLTITDDYGLPPEVTVMLLQYAQEVGKTGTAYIDSVARDWAEGQVFTLEAAERKLTDLSERRLAWNKVSAAAGLPKRSPTKKEEEAAFKWVKEWGFSPDMLTAAYERCADNTGKFSAAYIGRVLESWHAAGVRTLEDLAAYEEEKKAPPEARGKPAPAEKSYDIDELERLSFFSLPEDL